jgi:hypothetical protein
MRTSLLSACVVAGLTLHGAVAATVHPDAPQETRTLRADGEIVVTQEGDVHSHAIHTPLPDEMHEVVNKAVASWKFAPSAAPHATRNTMRLTLTATPVDSEHVVKVEDVVFRDVAAAHPDASGKVGKRTPDGVKILVRPRMPAFPVDAVVNVAMRVGPDGRIVDAHATQCSVHVSGGVGRDKARACRVLETHGVNAVKQWVLHPGGRTTAWTATVPLHFVGVNKELDETPGQWRKEYRTAYRAPAWHPDDEAMHRLGVVDAKGKSVVPPESELRLLGVIGEPL